MSSVRRVLIAGGGIAGMALAIGLQRVGIAAEIAEIDPEWRVYGAGITVTGPTLRAFDQLGLLERIEAEGYCSDAARICDTAGRVIMESRVSGRPLGARIPNSGGILRPVLHRILSDATRASDARVRLGVTVAALSDDGPSVTAHFSNGETADYDLAVGADGVHSGIRRLIAPDAPLPVHTGQGCWRAVIPRPPEIDRPHIFVGGLKAGVVAVSRDEMCLFLLQHVPGNPRMPEALWPELLAAQLQGFGGVLGDIREGLNGSSRINYRPLEKLLLAPPWHRGRVVLIGDAAHATTPHLASGAGLAVEDAIVLCALLKTEPTIEDALDGFMRRRYERCRMVVENSAALGELEMRGAPTQAQAELSRRSFEALNAPI